MQKTGIEMGIYQMKCGRIGAAKKNPLKYLFEEKLITKEEYHIACKYQYNYENSNKDGYAKPRSIYDGVPPSALFIYSENVTNQDRLDSAAFLAKLRKAIERYDKPRVFKDFKNSKSKTTHKRTSNTLNLLKIIDYVFEQQLKITYVEALLSMDRRTIYSRIKIICEIFVDTYSREFYCER